MKLLPRMLKSQARQAMASARPHVLPMTLLYLLLTSGISLLVALFFTNPLVHLLDLLSTGLGFSYALPLTVSQVGSIGLFLHLLALIATVVFHFGYTMWCYGTTKGGIGEYRDLLSVSTMVGRVLLLRLTIMTFSLLWYLVLSMLAMILASILILTTPFGLLSAIPIFAVAIGFFFWRILHYSLADLCLMESPDKGVFHAVYESRQLMHGHIGSFLRLVLSFFGWQLLSLLIQLVSDGIILVFVGGPALLSGDLYNALTIAAALPWTGVLSALLCWPFTAWLTPYQTMSRCYFYHALRENAPQ